MDGAGHFLPAYQDLNLQDHKTPPPSPQRVGSTSPPLLAHSGSVLAAPGPGPERTKTSRTTVPGPGAGQAWLAA